jgi:hypothetical protein
LWKHGLDRSFAGATREEEPVRYALFVVAGLGLLASWLVVAHGTAHTGIEVTDVWVDETAGPRSVANCGINEDQLLRVSFSSVAAHGVGAMGLEENHLGDELTEGKLHKLREQRARGGNAHSN